MSIISKETWDKFTQEEKEKIRRIYSEAKKVGTRNIRELEEFFGKENLQPQPLTYEDVEKEMDYYYSDEMMEKEKAIHQLLLVAKFLNKDWKPDWSDEKQQKFSFVINQNGAIQADEYYLNSTFVYFPCLDYVYKAIQILGEDIVRLALTTEY